MTVREIAKAVEKTERSIRNWITKLAEKSSVVAEKSSLSSPMNPADYNLDETIQIIETGMGKNAAMIFKQNAINKNVITTEIKPMDIMIRMMESQQQFMTAVLDKLENINKSSNQQLQIEQPKQDYYSLVAYCSLNKIKISFSELKKMGMDLRKMTIAKELEIKKIPDERWGTVNSYPIEILDEYFRM